MSEFQYYQITAKVGKKDFMGYTIGEIISAPMISKATGTSVNIIQKKIWASEKKGFLIKCESPEEREKKLEEINKEKVDFKIPNKEYLDILKNQNVFNNITEDELDKKIVGEVQTRKVIFLCACGRLVKNSQIASFNLLVNDDAGIGKDYVTAATLELLPEETYIHKTRISPTVFTYWHNPKKEPDWTWNGKVFYPEDISETVLNSDVFKVMTSKGSSATIVVNQQAIDIDIKGKPVMITTTASATPNAELTRRFVILNLDSSEDQTKKIMERHSEYKKKGIVPEYDTKYTEAMGLLKRVSVKIPFADMIDKHFPSRNIIMRTHYPRFLDFICASASFHQYQRKKDKGFVLAEGQDYDIARDCFLKLCSNKYMIPLTINQKKILGQFEKDPELKECASKLHGTRMNFLSLPALQTNLGILTKYGILTTETQKDNWNRDIEVFSLSLSYKPNEKFEIPTYKELYKITLTPLQRKSSLTPLIPLTPSENQGGSKGTKGIKPEICLNNPVNWEPRALVWHQCAYPVGNDEQCGDSPCNEFDGMYYCQKHFKGVQK